MNRLFLIIIIVVLVIGGVIFVQSQQTTPQPSTNQTSPTTTDSAAPTTEDTMGTTGELKEFSVTAQNYSFAPNTITVNQGDRVRITVISAGGTHDFVLDEFNVKTKMLDDGGSETIEFTANQTGTFEYYCSVGNHRAMGMKGTLTVK